MRILLINDHCVPVSGARYCFEVRSWLEAAGHQVIPFSFNYEGTPATPYRTHFPRPVSARRGPGAPARRLGPAGRVRAAGRLFRNAEVDSRFRALMTEARPDVVYALDLALFLLPNLFGIASREFDVPVVHRVSDFSLFCTSCSFLRGAEPCTECLRDPWSAVRHRCAGSSRVRSLLRVFQRRYFALRHWYDDVDVFLASTRLLGDLLLQRGIPSRCISHVPPAVSDTLPVDEVPRTHVLFLGRIDAQSGVDTLVDAFSRTPSGPVRLVLAGPVGAGYAAELRRLGAAAADRIDFVPEPSPAARRDLLAGARFVVHPSRWIEGEPAGVLDALAAGRAVMASELGTLPEFIDHEVNGWLVEPGDVFAWKLALSRALADPVRSDLEEQARRRYLAAYAPRVHCDRLVGLFDRCRVARLAGGTHYERIRHRHLSLSDALPDVQQLGAPDTARG